MKNKVGNASKSVIAVVIIFFLIPVLPFLPFIIYALSKISVVAWIIIAVSVVILSITLMYNKFVILSHKIKQASGTIDVYLKQRFDLIPNLVETVKGYANYEEEVLTKIVELRNEYDNNKGDLEVGAELNDRYNRLIATLEAYPELKTSESFLNLQKQLSKMESQLQAARRIYNSAVTEYNIKIKTFPNSILANICGFKDAKLFEIEENEKENIKIDL